VQEWVWRCGGIAARRPRLLLRLKARHGSRGRAWDEGGNAGVHAYAVPRGASGGGAERIAAG
jgi:hypothetical protein